MRLDSDRLDVVAAQAHTLKHQLHVWQGVAWLLLVGFVGACLFAFVFQRQATDLRGQLHKQSAVPTFAMPRCPEDAVLVGTGDFENGRWDAYVCGPAEDSYVSGPWDHVFAEWAESKDGQDTLARWLCTPHTQREWYLTVEPTACGEDE